MEGGGYPAWMTRRGQNKRKAQKLADTAALQAVTGEQGLYEPPPRQSCDERRSYLPMDDDHTIRIDVHQWRQAGRMVEFALTLALVVMRDGDVAWVDIARVDCRHGHAHGLLGPSAQKPPRSIMRLDAEGDIPEACDKSIAQLGVAGANVRETEGTPWMS